MPAGVVSAIHQGSLMSTSPHGKVLCADCGKAYRWQAELAGKKVRCTRCEGVMLFPTDAPGLDKAVKATMRSHGKPPGENARPTDRPSHATDSAARPTTHSTSSDSTDMTGAPGISGMAGASGEAEVSGGGLIDPAGSSSLPINEELGIDLDLDVGAPAPGGGGDMIDIRAAEETPPSSPGGPASPAANAAPRDAGESAEKVCPSCKAALSPNAVLCVKCGFNLKKGKATTSNLDGNSGGLLSRLTRGWRKGGA